MIGLFRHRSADEPLPEPAVEIAFTDLVIDALAARLTTRPPERGAILLGIGNLATAVIEDDHGDYSGAHWDVSDAAVRVCDEAQRAGRGYYIGQVHSHPEGVRDPSGADRNLMLNALRTNAHRNALLVPIVSRGHAGSDDLQLTPTHLMTTMVARRGADSDAMMRARARVVPLGAQLAAAGFIPPSVSTSTTSPWADQLQMRVFIVEGVNHIGVPIPDNRVLLFSADYPVKAPLILNLPFDGVAAKVTEVPDWNAERPEVALRLVAARGTERLARVEPILGPINGRVVIAGAGSVGSGIAVDLARSGVREFTVIDPDVVSAANLSRSVYVAADIGQPKTESLARHLQAIDPDISVNTLGDALGSLDLAEVVRGAALVVGATDDMEQQFQLGEYAYHEGVPMVACALYRRAEAGEVIVTVPAARTACLRCTIRDWDPEVRPDKNYGAGGRLEAEPGLGPSINLVASYASLVALGVLAGPHTKIGRNAAQLVGTGRTFGKIATVPDWDFFSEVLGTPRHQHAPQSVWIKVPRDQMCTTCGDQRIPPLGADDVSELAAYIAAAGEVP